MGTPSSLVSIQPRGSATWDEPRRASAVVTSRSGLGPGDSLRKTLSIDSSPKTRLVLDCSPVRTRLSSPVVKAAPSIFCIRSVSTLASAAMAARSGLVRSASCSASYAILPRPPKPSPTGPILA